MKALHTRQFAWRERGLILLLLLIGAALRLWAVGRIPSGLYHDEAHHGLDALNVLSGDFPLYFASNNGREPLFIYMVTGWVSILGRSPLAVRLPAFFAGFLTLAATYDLGRVLFERKIGLWSLAVLSVTLWHVHLSRVGFRAVLLPLFIALFISQSARAIKTHNPIYWITAGILYGLAWYTYMAVRFTPVVLLMLLLYGLLFHRSYTLRLWKGIGLFCTAALIVLMPLGLYTLRYPEIVLTRTGHVSILNPDINQGDLWEALVIHTWRTLATFFIRGDRIWRHNLAWRPIWDPALGLFFMLGLGILIGQSKRNAPPAIVLIWTALMLIPTLLAEDAPHFLRSVGILPVVVLIPATGLNWLTTKFKGLGSLHVLSLIPVIAWTTGLASTTYDYFVRYANASQTYHWFESGPVEVAGEINTLIEEGWNGQAMLHGPDHGRQIYVAPQIWNSWTAMPFLVPKERIEMLSNTQQPNPNKGMAFVVWPYRDWTPKVLPYLPHPACLSVTEGPEAQGDKDEKPFTVALIIQAEPNPQSFEPIARFQEQIILNKVEVHSEEGDVRVHLWWQAEEALSTHYTVFVHYRRDGETLAQHDGEPGRSYLPTTFWQPGDLVVDEHDLPGITPDPTQDMLRIGLYRRDTGEGLSVLDGAGNPAGTWIDLGFALTPQGVLCP